MLDKHYVLVGANDKQASRRDQWRLALQMQAEKEAAAGRGGGLVDLLLPRTPQEAKELARARKKYRLKSVKRRSPRERKSARDLVVFDDELMDNLVLLYVRERGHLSSAQTLERFTDWICINLRNSHSEAVQLLKDSQLVLTERQPSWWRKQIAERRKRFKQKKTAS
jgi:hypothetical protein